MASQRFRLDVDSVSGGVVPSSSVVYAQTAGAAAGFIDVYMDNTDIKSMAMLEDMLLKLSLAIKDRYRQSVGGV